MGVGHRGRTQGETQEERSRAMVAAKGGCAIARCRRHASSPQGLSCPRNGGPLGRTLQVALCLALSLLLLLGPLAAADAEARGAASRAHQQGKGSAHTVPPTLCHPPPSSPLPALPHLLDNPGTLLVYLVLGLKGEQQGPDFSGPTLQAPANLQGPWGLLTSLGGPGLPLVSTPTGYCRRSHRAAGAESKDGSGRAGANGE